MVLKGRYWEFSLWLIQDLGSRTEDKRVRFGLFGFRL